MYFNTLDYNTGKLKNTKNYKADYPPSVGYYRSFTDWSTEMKEGANGSYYIYGQLNSVLDFSPDHNDVFGVLEFDNSLSFVKGYSVATNVISKTYQTSFYSNEIYVNENGKAVMMFFQYPSPNEQTMYNATIKDYSIIKSKLVHLPDVVDYGWGDITIDNSEALLFTQTYGPASTSKYYMELRKLYDSDTSQNQCLGKDTSFAYLKNLSYAPYLPFVTDTIYNQISAVENEITTATINLTKENGCSAISACDTIKIHGQQSICGSQSSATYTAYKNPGCGAGIMWNIDTSAIVNTSYLNDTTVTYTFKENWNGKLFAKTSGGSCVLPVTDSLTINVQCTNITLELGADTALCTGNSIQLEAGDFSKYTWQDGSSKPMYEVTKAGTYYVDVTDYCNNVYTDTIHIKTADYPFSLGNDTIKCNNDSILLTASGGFINYHWLSQYNAGNPINNTLLVSPATDTSYSVQAEMFPGCFVRDTIRVSVLHSSPVFLGNDTSFCVGQIVQLDAGSGFTVYSWNTGEITQTIKAFQKGLYAVKATAANRCNSFDTLSVVNVNPQPTFTLGNDTTLCDDTQLIYDLNLPDASYLWSDGSVTSSRAFTQPGKYWLAITQQGCTSSDTIRVSFQPSPVLNLGNDTTLCEGAVKLLDATNSNATYKWQDNSTLPQYEISHAGLYHVMVSVNGCFSSDSITVHYIPKPSFNLGENLFLCRGSSLVLTPSVNTPVNYLWQDGSASSFYEVKQAGFYTLLATNTCGSLKDSISITSQTCELNMPSAFTPNRDGENDVFKVKYPFLVKQFYLVIYNRWGQKIFESYDMAKGWDGTIHNVDQNQDTYIWMITLVDNDNVKQTIHGTVTLIR